MAGTWTGQSKVLPGPYINFQTNAPLSITVGERGIVVLLQEMSVGTEGAMYTITATDASKWPTGATTADKFLAGEILKNAKTVIVYNLGVTAHTADEVTTALAALKTVTFNVLCYPYPAATFSAEQTAISTWITAMRNDEGVKVQAVMADMVANSEGVINVAQGVVLADNTELTSEKTTAWVAGATAGAAVNQSNTGAQYAGAIDVSPRMTRSDMETAVTAGKFIFKVDTMQNVTAVYDINSLTAFTDTKSKVYRKNRVIRTLDGIDSDITIIWNSNISGKFDNNADGRSCFRTMLVDYFNTLQKLNAIQNFSADDVTVSPGNDSDAVVVICAIQPVDSMEKLYMTVNLS